MVFEFLYLVFRQGCPECNAIHLSICICLHLDLFAQLSPKICTKCNQSRRIHKKGSPIQISELKYHLLALKQLYRHSSQQMQSLPFLIVLMVEPIVTTLHGCMEMLHPGRKISHEIIYSRPGNGEKNQSYFKYSFDHSNSDQCTGARSCC